VKALLRYIGEGLPDSKACALAGIGYSTFHRWIQQAETGRGQDGQPLLAEGLARLLEFREARNKARAKRAQVLIRRVESEPGGSRWLLQRTFPEDFGDPALKVAIEGSVDLTVARGEIDRLVARIAEAEEAEKEED
jgi:transposase-like protein